MPDLDRVVGGLRCRDVLGDLSEFLDGLLGPERLEMVQAHLAGCSTCAQFGADIAGVLTALRSGAPSRPTLPDHALERLRARVASAIARPSG